MVGHSPEADVVGRGDSSDDPLDEVFDLLADQRRRAAFACLVANGEAIALADLAEDVAAHENEAPITVIPDEAVKTIEVTLHHVHLPKLEAAGAVERDGDDGLIRVSDTADLEEWVLDVTGDDVEKR